MTSLAHRASPAFVAVVAQQMRLLWHSGRVLFIAALITGSLLATAAVVAYLEADVDLLMLSAAPAVLFAAALWGVLLWRDEPPRSRQYHWSMPVDMMHHDLARALAGAAWLLVVIVSYVLVGVGLALLAGDTEALLRALPLLLLHLAAAPLILYFLAGALSTGANRPTEWIVLLYFGLAFGVFVAEWLGQNWLMRGIERLIGGPHGLGYVLVIGWRGAEVRVTDPAHAQLSTYLGEWLPFAVLWLLIAVAILSAVAFYRRGRAA